MERIKRSLEVRDLQREKKGLIDGTKGNFRAVEQLLRMTLY